LVFGPQPQNPNPQSPIPIRIIFIGIVNKKY